MLQTGGLVQGPTTGAISSDPVQYIGDGALAIAQVAQLQAQLAQKHPLLGQGDLPQDRVANLVNDLGARALSSEVAAQFGTKADAAATATALAGKADSSALDAKADAAALTSGLAGKQDTIGDAGLTIAKTSGLQDALDTKATTAALTSGLAGKQDTIGDGALTIAKTSGLQSALDAKATTAALTSGLAGKQDTIGDAGLTIAKTSGLQDALNAKATTADLAGKQDTITDSSAIHADSIRSRVYLPNVNSGFLFYEHDLSSVLLELSTSELGAVFGVGCRMPSLNVASDAKLGRILPATAGQSLVFADGLGNDLLTLGAANAYSTQGLVAPWFSTTGSIVAQGVDLLGAINSKQPSVTDDSLQISHVAGLQTALDNAGGEIADGELTIAQTNGLQDALDSKADSTSVTTQLSYKQNLIGTDSLVISNPSGLQAALDSKGAALSDLPGTGTSFLYDPAQGIVRKIYGEAGVSVDQTLDLDNPSDPNNFQIRVSGSALEAAIAQKADSSALLSYLLNSGPAIFNGDLDVTGHCTLGRVVLGSGSLEEHNNGSFRVLNAVHDVGFNFAVSASSPPASADVVLSLDASTGATIQGAMSVSGNASVAGAMNVGGGLGTGGSVTIQGTDVQLFSAERAGGNSHPGRALVHLGGDQLGINYASDFSGGTTIDSACTVSGALSAPSLACSLLKAAPGQSGVAITNASGTVLLNLGAGANTFLNGISAPALESTGDLAVGGALTVGGTDVMDAIANAGGGGSAIDSSTNLSVNTLTTAANVLVQGSSASGALLQLKSTGTQGSQIDFQTTVGGNVYSNHTIRQTGNDLQFWRALYNIQSFAISNFGYVHFYQGHGDSSDRKLKDNIEDASTSDALNVLKSVSARTYTRNDLHEDVSSKLGFVAQEVAAALPDEWGNLVNTDGHSDELGQIMTLDYGRLTAVLWQSCRSLLARVEALEAQLS